MQWLRFFVLAVCFLCLFVNRVQAQEQLTTLSQSINEKLFGLKDELQTLQLDLVNTTAQLRQVSSDLQLSNEERMELLQQLTNSSASLEATTKKYNDLSNNLTIYKARLDQAHKVAFWLLIILGVRLVGMIAGYIIYAKGIYLPRWLDILL